MTEPPQKLELWLQVQKAFLCQMNELPPLVSHHSYQTEWSWLLMGPTGTHYIMYQRYMTGLHCSFYGFIGPFIVLHESFAPVPFSALPPDAPRR